MRQLEAIGLLELNSIATGIEATDAMLKAAEVHLISAQAICPGKYFVLVAGNVAAVEASLSAGNKMGKSFVVDQILIPNIHPQVFPAFTASTPVKELAALGVIETFSIAAAVMAADAASKAAAVELIEIRLATGLAGKAFVTLTGDVASVEAAVTAGSARAKDLGLLVSCVVIPSPHPDLAPTIL